jgi:hypothetical protein
MMDDMVGGSAVFSHSGDAMMRSRTRGVAGVPVVLLAAAALAGAFGCDGAASDDTPTPLSVVVTPADLTVRVGMSRQLAATATHSDGSTRDVTSATAWDSSDPTVATIDSSGLVEPVAPGTTTVTAVSGELSASTTITVPGAATTLDSPFGFHTASVQSFEYVDRGFADASRIGVTWSREGVYAFWFLVQPDLADPTYDFSMYDEQWGGVPAGIRILGNIAPQGPVDEGYCEPGSYRPLYETEYVAFVEAVVERYDGDGDDQDMPLLASPIKYWQVGNEPNANKPGFADLQRITYGAIKSACPDCVVLIGGVPGMPPADLYISNFDARYRPILDALGGGYVDVMDFHWYGDATGDYRDVSDVYDHIRSVLVEDGFPEIPIWITEMGAYSGDPTAPAGAPSDFGPQTEREQALDYFKRFVFPLSIGVGKVFPAFGLMEGLAHDGEYFDYTGLIYDGWDLGSATDDLGLGVKKLGYFTYQKMTEMLEGCDWAGIQTIRASGNVYVFRLTKGGRPIHVAWWDYFDDAAYTPGATIEVSIDGVEGDTVLVTEALPAVETGAEVGDFETAFPTAILTPSGGTATLRLGDSPVIVNEQ